MGDIEGDYQMTLLEAMARLSKLEAENDRAYNALADIATWGDGYDYKRGPGTPEEITASIARLGERLNASGTQDDLHFVALRRELAAREISKLVDVRRAPPEERPMPSDEDAKLVEKWLADARMCCDSCETQAIQLSHQFPDHLAGFLRDRAKLKAEVERLERMVYLQQKLAGEPEWGAAVGAMYEELAALRRSHNAARGDTDAE